MRQIKYKHIALACAYVVISNALSVEAQENPKKTDIFQRQERSRDIFSSQNSTKRRSVRQTPQSAPVPPARARLLGEDRLTPEMQKALTGDDAGAGADAALKASRSVRERVETLTRSGNRQSRSLKGAFSTIRAVAHQSSVPQSAPQAPSRTEPQKEKTTKSIKPRSGFVEPGRATIRNEFVPPSTLSLVVDGSDSKHVQEQLRRLAKIAKKKNVKIGNVYIVGVGEIKNILTKKGGVGSASKARKYSARSGARKKRGGAKGPNLAKLLYRSFYGFLEEAGLGSYQVVKSDQVLKRWNVTYSPTWIVRHKGRDFVFEGFTKPESFFNREGEFVREDS